MIAALLSLVAALTATPSAAPKAEVRNVRIFAPKIAVSREAAGKEAQVTGQIRVDMSFAKNSARKPVLRLSCLCEVDGALSVHTIFLDRPRTTEGMRRSAIMEAYRNAQVEIPHKEREQAYADPAKFTPHLPEVTRAAYAGAVYGTGEISRGFFRLGRSGSLPKVILHRVEVWQNGALVASCESSRSGLGGYDIPDDWYEWKRHPQKFKYMDIR